MRDFNPISSKIKIDKALWLKEELTADRTAARIDNASNSIQVVLKHAMRESYTSVHIKDLWVDKSYRGQGYGRKLITELERLYKHNGFDNINLVTCAFQAPEFYKKCGFKQEFIRENIKNPKLTITFIVKIFEEE